MLFFREGHYTHYVLPLSVEHARFYSSIARAGWFCAARVLLLAAPQAGRLSWGAGHDSHKHPGVAAVATAGCSSNTHQNIIVLVRETPTVEGTHPTCERNRLFVFVSHKIASLKLSPVIFSYGFPENPLRPYFCSRMPYRSQPKGTRY